MIYVINWFVNILTLGLISIATITTTTYHVDEPIPELNNLSLTQVFEDGNLLSGATPYTNISGFTNDNNTFLHHDYVVDSILSSARLQRSGNDIALNEKAYFRFTKESNNSSSTQLNVGWHGSVNFGTYNGGSGKVDYSAILTHDNTASGYADGFFRLYNSTKSMAQYEIISYYDNYLINLTSLGIDTLTQAEMDYWFSIYQQAVANNGVYIESNAHLNNNIHLVDVSVMVISFGLWTWLFKFLKGVVL